MSDHRPPHQLPQQPPQEPPYEWPSAPGWPPAPATAPPPPPQWPPPLGFDNEPPRKPPASRAAVAVLVVLAMLAGAFGAIVGASMFGVDPLSSTATRRSPTVSLPPGTSSDVVQKTDASIVNINVTFGNALGAGTGMVLTSSGLVLTNNHVIAGATKIQATSVDTGDTYSASVLGYDITDDVALIQLKDASDLTPITTGDSGDVNEGDAVIALGNALGQGGTPATSVGNVRALDQSIDVQDDDGTTSTLNGLIETSARLQPGDSGGPLVDQDSGKVIGMDVAATTSRSGRTANDSFAIPINTVLDVAKKIQAGEGSDKIHIGPRALLGVTTSNGQSAVVATVQSGGPAESAGIERGDTITSIDGTQISSADGIVAALNAKKPGDSVSVTWQTSSGQQKNATVELIEGPAA